MNDKETTNDSIRKCARRQGEDKMDYEPQQGLFGDAPPQLEPLVQVRAKWTRTELRPTPRLPWRHDAEGYYHIHAQRKANSISDVTHF
jgi:hypothetical protein